MTVRSTWERFVNIAIEPSWGSDPTAGWWNQLGKWIELPVQEGVGGLTFEETKIRPRAVAGKRSLDQMPPLDGAQVTGGTLDVLAIPDSLGWLLYAALGAESVSATADSNNSLLSAYDMSGGDTSLTSQPDATSVLALTVASLAGSGNITITGTDINDDSISETIAVSADGTYYTRKMFKSVVTDGVAIAAGITGGTLTIDGYNKYVHTFTCADTNPSLQIEDYGDPSAGSGKSWFYKGMVISELGLSFDVTDEGGILTLKPTFAGKTRTAASKTSARVSPHVPLAGWTASANNGSAFNKIISMDLTIKPNAGVYRAAVGSQSPAGAKYGGRLVEGTMRILVEDNTEYDKWAGNTLEDMVITFTSPELLSGSTYASLVLDLSAMYYETFPIEDADGIYAAATTFFTVEDATDNVVKATLTTCLPDVW